MLNSLIAQIQSNKTNPKSKLTFQKWTKKMSKNEKSNKVLKKACKFMCCDHNALKMNYVTKKSVTIKNYIFYKNYLGTFSLTNISTNGNIFFPNFPKIWLRFMRH